MDIDRDDIDPDTSDEMDAVCPRCGDADVELGTDGMYVCPACGSSFDREDIEDAVELDDEDGHDS